MFIPLYDTNPTHRIPFQYVTIAIISMCTIAFLWQQTLFGDVGARIVYGLGVIPAVIVGSEELPHNLVIVPDYLTLITSMFLHGSWMHLIGNMIFLWVLGDNVEDAMGHLRYLVFFCFCGLTAALSHAIIDFQSTVPMIGASGAISGIIGAYLLLHPRASIYVLVGYFVVGLPAWVALGVWIVLQCINVAMDSGGNVAWWAHICGALAGIIFVPFFKHHDIQLFNIAKPKNSKAQITCPSSQVRPKGPRGIQIIRIPRHTRNQRKGPTE